jgi:hypothetical protein
MVAGLQIGVQYVRKTEFQSHYIECCLPQQFDIVRSIYLPTHTNGSPCRTWARVQVIHIDKTTALQPLEGDA